MKFKKFADKVKDLKNYPETSKVVLPAIWLAEEVGEIEKPIKHSIKSGDPYDTDNIGEEIGDVLLCLANLALDLDLDLDTIAEDAIEKLTKRIEDDNKEE